MPVKTALVSSDYVRNVPLPQHGKTYTVIPHGHAITETHKAIFSEGFTLASEQYKATADGQIVQGVYHINYDGIDDPDMGIMFAWSNSYNKTMRFKCAVGAHVFICMNGVVRGDMSSYVRIHKGLALAEATSHINEQISKAKEYFETLREDKDVLKNVLLTSSDKGTILGQLYAEHEILTLTQVGIVKRELDKPSHHYNCDPDSAWAMYNHITLSLKESHPASYLDDHESVHQFFIDRYGNLTTPVKTHYDQLEFTGDTVAEHAFNTDEELKEQFLKQEFELVPASSYGVTFM